MNQTILAAHKAVLAAQACLDSVQHALLALMEADEQKPKPTGECDHPVEARIVLDTMGGSEVMCNECGRNILP